MLTVGSLFAGIGGFDLGLERAGMRVRWQVEIDPYCQRVLAKHWPDVPRYGDIKTVDWATVEPVDLICGGFPCQPFSCAGQQRGTADNRYLWPDIVRCLDALRPTWFLGENVPGIINLALDAVCTDLENLGYTVWPVSLPACAVGAPHIRQRVWILAYHSEYGRRPWREMGSDSSGTREQKQPLQAVADANAQHRERGGQRSSANSQAGASRPEFIGGRAPLADTGRALLEGWGASPSTWWATEPAVGRVAHGIPHRVDRLRGLGNAVVPQIVHWLGEQIMKVERENLHRLQRDETSR